MLELPFNVIRTCACMPTTLGRIRAFKAGYGISRITSRVYLENRSEWVFAIIIHSPGLGTSVKNIVYSG